MVPICASLISAEPDCDPLQAKHLRNPGLTLTVEEAAAPLGISRPFAYEAVRRGEIPSIRIGRRVLVPESRSIVL
jgi:excisionase family DNA binding protein